MGSEEFFLRTNNIAATVPLNGKSVNAANLVSAPPLQNKKAGGTDSNDSLLLRTPPTRTSQLSTVRLALAIVRGGSTQESDRKKLAMLNENIPDDPFEGLSSTTDLRVNWASVDTACVGNRTEGFIHSLSDESSTEASFSPTSSTESPSSESPLVSESISTLSSLSQRDNSNRTNDQLLHSQGKGIKEKIDLYENMCHKNSDKSQGTIKHQKCPSDFDFKLYPTMKLRDTYLDEPEQCCDREESQQVFEDVSLSPGHNLSLPKGSGKYRKVSYRIRFAIPENSEQSVKDRDNEEENAPVEKFTANRGGGICGIRGYNRSNNWVSWRESESEDKIDKDDCDRDSSGVEGKNKGHCTPVADDSSDTKSESSCSYRCDFYRPPDVWITPIKSRDGSQKWIAKRVWDIEDRDDEEPEYEVDHWCLMRGVRGMMGIPEEMGLIPEEWQVNIDERDPWEMTESNDAAPNLPKRTKDHYEPRLLVKQIINVDGQREESASIPLDEGNFYDQLLNVVDFPHLERSVAENSGDTEDLTDANSITDSDSHASFISLVDYIDFDGSDASSCSISIPTNGTDDSSYQLPLEGDLKNDSRPNEAYQDSFDSLRVSNHSKRGFGRPDEWVRPKDILEDTREKPRAPKMHQRAYCRRDGYASPNDADEDTSEYSESTECNHHSQRGFGRPDDWIRPKNLYQESSECGVSESGKQNSHSERGFGRPNEWVRPNDSCGVSTECRSCRSPSMSRTSQDKSARESTPEDNSPFAKKSPISLAEYLEVHNSEHSKCVGGESGEHSDKTSYIKKKETKKANTKKSREKSSSQKTFGSFSSQYDLEDEYKRGTPTWEKRALQQNEEVSNIKLWWEC